MRNGIYSPLILLFKAFLSAFLFFAGSAVAADLITSRAYVVDASAQMSLHEIEREPSIPFKGVLSRGYTDDAIWVKLEISPPKGSKAEDEIVLRIRPVYLDEISLFDPLDQSGKPRAVGDAVPKQAEEFTSLSHTFVVPAGEQKRVVWLRAKTTSTSLLNVEALSRDEMLRSELALNLFYFSVLSIVGIFALLVLTNWFNNRDTLYAVFVVRQIYYFFYTASLFGLHRFVFSNLPAESLDAMFCWIVIGATALSFLFENRFLNEYLPPTWVKLVLAGLMCWSASTFVLMLMGQTMAALHVNMLLNTFGIVTLLILSILFIDQEKVNKQKNKVLLSKHMVVGYYLSVNLVLIFCLLPILGWLDGNELAVNALIVYTLFSSLIMTALMQLRARKQKIVQAEYEKKLLLSEQAIALEKTRREEQTHLFHMLMHELKTPLSIIDLALVAKNDQQTTSAYVSRAVGNMKDILERCVKADKLTEGSVEIHYSVVEVNTYIRKLLSEKTDSNVEFTSVGSMEVTTDPQFLSVMLNNLLDNAQRYGDAFDVVTLKTQAKQNAAGESGVAITIANRPNTASWPDSERVFTKYYRSAGAESQSGTGLGLYLVRTLARLVGGDCLYVPDEKFVRFELWLPS